MQKNFKTGVNTVFDKIVPPINLITERLSIDEIKEEDKFEYAALYLDDDLNRWWGYDYREDLGTCEPNPDYFFNFQNSLKEKKEEFPFAVRRNGKMIGELTLYNFDADGGAEIGFRFFKDCQGKGYAFESATALKEYVFEELKAVKLKTRCCKENLSSAKLIDRLGFVKTDESDAYYFFECDAPSKR